MYREWKQIEFPNMNLESTRPRGRKRNRWQGKVTEDGRIVGGVEWQAKYITKKNGRSF
jgi:hypothetical protein